MKKFDTILCNPPYNGDNGSPIYHEFLDLFKNRCTDSVWIFPDTWIGDTGWATGKTIRKSLDRMGLFSVWFCGLNTFPNAKVVTSVCICSQKTYPVSSFEVFDRDTPKKKVQVDRKTLLRSKIFSSTNQDEIDFVLKMREKHGGEKIRTFDRKPGTWKIGPYNVVHSRSFDKPYSIRLLDADEFDAAHSGKFINFWEGSPGTKDEAEEMLERVQSFWYSKLVKFLVNRVWTSYTLNSWVFEWIPEPDYSRVWTDEELYEKYGLSKKEIKMIERCFK